MTARKNDVVVVTISEQFQWHGNKTDIAVFASMSKAEAWIDRQIALLVKRWNIPPESVDGWFVEIEDTCHTIQYDLCIKSIR